MIGMEDRAATHTSVPQVAVDALSKQDRAVTHTPVPQVVVESLSKQDRAVTHTYIPQIAIEVLTKSFTRWPHGIGEVPNANIQKILGLEIAWILSAGEVA